MKLFLSHKQKHSAKKTDFRSAEESNTTSSRKSHHKQRLFYTSILGISLLVTSVSAVRALDNKIQTSTPDEAASSSPIASPEATIEAAQPHTSTQPTNMAEDNVQNTQSEHTSEISVEANQNTTVTVSYTHLTLPTIYSV